MQYQMLAVHVKDKEFLLEPNKIRFVLVKKLTPRKFSYANKLACIEPNATLVCCASG